MSAFAASIQQAHTLASAGHYNRASNLCQQAWSLAESDDERDTVARTVGNFAALQSQARESAAAAERRALERRRKEQIARFNANLKKRQAAERAGLIAPRAEPSKHWQIQSPQQREETKRRYEAQERAAAARRAEREAEREARRKAAEQAKAEKLARCEAREQARAYVLAAVARGEKRKDIAAAMGIPLYRLKNILLYARKLDAAAND